MAENDDRRVEARLDLNGRGLSATPERIAELQHQARELDKLHSTPPARTFEMVMAEKGGRAAPPTLSAKEKKRSALPKKGPKPSLRHPAQRQAYGREEDSDEPVILKG